MNLPMDVPVIIKRQKKKPLMIPLSSSLCLHGLPNPLIEFIVFIIE